MKMERLLKKLLDRTTFVVETYEHAYSNISSGGNISWNETVTKAGYYPIGVVGFTSGRAGLGCEIARLTNNAIGSGDLTCHFKNFTSSSISGNSARAYVLWVKV